ncbi:MAG: PHP domain-containing protein [Oscillospiraceae bacterium]|nr:PHP domain-containing protein [Oscillospiraceae bacterium]
MFFHEATYDLEELARSNFHIHTSFSACAKRDIKLPAILREAERSGLERVALTDHSPATEKPLMRQIADLKRQYRESGAELQVLFGAELSAFAPGEHSETELTREQLDYRLASTNHYHMEFWGHPEEKTAAGYKAHNFSIVRALFKAPPRGRTDCVAHPFYGRFVRALPDETELTRSITDSELGDILQEGTRAQVAWELNAKAVMRDPGFYRRYFNIGRETGAVFNFGTDAHRLEDIDPRPFLEPLRKILL